ncbi:DotI/IcmL family type IV secretion protein [Pseudomonas fluorescens]|uniref:DotI/IcmL family type IV secretion protein n=1 Tax=Pseudomonas TaxID=286 RepID=UPI0013CEFDA6|nr:MULTISPECIES: DotI/IcmL family type IV secretion protein [Pseudomonas]MBD8089207.1 DotI/IcmL family type IV secretion protein [Pseudomonas fluorescens]MBD8615366.1 DotI/IcmL family type IV secretion protein [Pseudomonas putida]MBD8681980.1 DotI/IcmL family type IV secretion protein [Pseudomonas sp. CFBP 13719]
MSNIAQKTKAPVKKAPAPGSSIPKGEGLATVTHRNEFFKTGDRKLTIMLSVVVVVMCIQIFVAFLGFTARNERVYFATDRNGSLIRLIALGEPNQKDTVVAQWLQNALVDTFSFDFTNINTRLNEATMKWFNDNGANELLKAMKDSGNFDVITDRRMILTTTLNSTPILVGKKPNAEGVYSWTFQVDAIMTFRTQSQEFTNNVRFTVVVDRRSVLEDVNGLGISKVVMTKR